VIVMFGAIGTLFFVPWVDRSHVRSMLFRPVMKQFFWILIAVCLLLGYIGAQRPDDLFTGTPIPDVWLARIGTIYFYAYFWILLPLVPLFESTKPLPASIATPVLAPAE